MVLEKGHVDEDVTIVLNSDKKGTRRISNKSPKFLQKIYSKLHMRIWK